MSLATAFARYGASGRRKAHEEKKPRKTRNTRKKTKDATAYASYGALRRKPKDAEKKQRLQGKTKIIIASRREPP